MSAREGAHRLRRLLSAIEAEAHHARANGIDLGAVFHERMGDSPAAVNAAEHAERREREHA